MRISRLLTLEVMRGGAYRDEGLFAGQDYGAGSSRDWAAKGFGQRGLVMPLEDVGSVSA